MDKYAKIACEFTIIYANSRLKSKLKFCEFRAIRAEYQNLNRKNFYLI